MKKFGFNLSDWEAAVAEGKEILTKCARERRMLPYSDFVAKIRTVTFEGPHDPRFFHLLGQISTEESEAGRGMLSALVVHKHGDYQPGPGFFELARSLGHDTEDLEKFWIQEIKRIFAAWQS